jgi:phosphoribosylamine--glycine ligase
VRIAIIGQGGREHALAWRLVREGHEIIGVPGNPGIAELGRCVEASVSDVQALTAACQAERPDLVVIGPEAPLAAGLADRLRQVGLTVFGPSQAATRIESSKAFSKQLMQRAGVPTARFRTVTTAAELESILAELGGAVAVKADGLAAGKGVVVCSTVTEAYAAALPMLSRGPVIVEERLVGPELSVIGVTDGKHVAILPPSRDHKRLLDGDEGPNTGGMGAVAPVPVPAQWLDQVRETIFRPTLAALAADGAPFTGALFAGLMLTPEGPRVLEFNARFGDPETQAILTSLSADVQLGQLLLRSATGQIADEVLPSSGAVCSVVMASHGYPDSPRSGDVIEGLPAAREQGALVFHAGTRSEGDQVVTAGGRVLSVVARGPTLSEARDRALEAARRIHFSGAQFRTDIGATTE